MGTIIRGLLHRGSLTLFYGPPKSGKSFLVTGLFLAIAADDKEWMGHAATMLLIAVAGVLPMFLLAMGERAGEVRRTFRPFETLQS